LVYERGVGANVVGQEDLLREIDRQKEFYLLQKKKRRGLLQDSSFT
jgi:hypothetical protein